jgi:peptide/nickel transport system permease protein
MVALAFVAFEVLVAVLAPVVANHDPNRQHLTMAFQAPSPDHWLGTDDLGRDLFARVLFGARISLRVSFQVVASALVVALPIGLSSGYLGGKVDGVLMRVTDAIMSFPPLILALAIAGVLGPGLNNAALALTVVFVPSFARLIRAQTLGVRQETFVEASRSIGTPTRRILFRRVLPNAISPVVVQASLALGSALLAEAALSFLGLGVQPPAASWGSMLRRSFDFIFTKSWMMLIPGAAIALTVLAYNTVGDGLRDSLGISGSRRRDRGARRGLTTVDSAAPIRVAQRPGPAPVLVVDGLEVTMSATAGGVKVVEGVSFEIGEGETLGLVGESGSGKTVTSLAIMRLLPSPTARITAGTATLHGRDLFGLSFREIRAVRGPVMAMIFQDPMTSLNPAFTIGSQIAEAMRWHEPVNRGKAAGRAMELLDLVGIPASRVHAYPHELSGGMRQRTMIAIALACRPKLLIADEPTTALDVTIQAQILELLKSLRHEMGMSMLFVTHDLGVVADICDRVAVMYAGQIVEQASATELFQSPKHPYTEGLLKAMPQDATPGEPLFVIPGRVPSPGEHEAGCRFANRCDHARPECVAGAVPLLEAAGEHVSRCVRVKELALGRHP